MKNLLFSSKNIISLFLPLFLALFILTDSSYAAPPSQEELLKSQIKLFQEAIDYLKIYTPQEAAKLWAMGEKTRNGVLQYRAACPKLREQLIKALGSPGNNLWVIGTSSPWITSYKLSEPIALNKDSCEIIITYRLSSSSGEEKPQRVLLKLRRNGEEWCVEEAGNKATAKK